MHVFPFVSPTIDLQLFDLFSFGVYELDAFCG